MKNNQKCSKLNNKIKDHGWITEKLLQICCGTAVKSTLFLFT